MNSIFPNFEFEIPLWEKGCTVLGCDEVGRGCLAGPLFVCAVSLKGNISANDHKRILQMGINDSKKLTAKKRQALSPTLKEDIFDFALGKSSTKYINTQGVVKATENAIRQAVNELLKTTNPKKPFLLMDAFYTKNIRGIGLKNQKAIIHGDNLSIMIAAASIIAKVERDKFMEKLSCQFPHYKWEQNKGYGTKKHREAIEKFGVNQYHRTLFLRKLYNTQYVRP